MNKYFLKNFAITLLLGLSSFLFAGHTIAQHHEFGLGLGAMNYAGDLQRGYHFESIRPGGQLFYRYNYNPIISLRGALTVGGVTGSDDKPIDPFAQERMASFGITVMEIAADFEYNFLDIKSGKNLNKWTPYLFMGFGAFVIFGDEPVNGQGEYSNFQPVIPFGTGIKIELNPYFNLGFEVGLRKLFTDWIDDVSEAPNRAKNYQYGNKFDKDWYNFFGITLSYTIYAVDCPYNFYHTQGGK